MTYEHKVKCLTCQLHFTAYSWQEDWKPTSCPECGDLSNYLHWRDTSDQQIYMLVPGGSPMVEVSA